MTRRPVYGQNIRSKLSNSIPSYIPTQGQKFSKISITREEQGMGNAVVSSSPAYEQIIGNSPFRTFPRKWSSSLLKFNTPSRVVSIALRSFNS
jgi:hypothetical protein